MSEEETNYDRREAIFEFIRNVFGTKEFTLIAAWKEINNSEILGDLYSDLDVGDVYNWFCEATIDDGDVPPEVSLEMDSIDVGCRKYSMLGTCESMERWRPRLRIQLELKRLALSKLYEDSISDRDEDADRSSNEDSESLGTDVEESFKLTSERVESSRGTSASHDELEVSSEVERTISEAVKNARREFEAKLDGRSNRGKSNESVKAKLENWLRRRFLDGNLVYDECGNRVSGVRFDPQFRKEANGTYKISELKVVPFPSKGEVKFEELIDNFVEDLINDPIDAVKTVDPKYRIRCYDSKNYNYEVLKLTGWDGLGWYFWDENFVGLHGPFDTEEEARSGMKVHDGIDDRITYLSISTIKGREVPGWNGPGWYVWDAPQWKVCGPFETEVFASEWWNEVKRRAEKRSIDADGCRKLVFYSPFGHEVEVKGWSGSGYYFWADDGSAVHGPYDSEFAASNARDEYEKVLERSKR